MAEKETHFDVVVIGGGPGGYPAAIKAAQNGAKVALIEKEHLGGTCLNWGCIPTKTLIANAELLSQIQKANDFGISVDKVSFDFGAMTDRKDNVVEGLRNGLSGLIKANKIELFRGFGQFTSPKQIKVTGEDNAIITTDKTIVACGSKPKEIKAFPFDHKKVMSSDSILALRQLPKSLVIIGGGVIGCEFASLYSKLGVKVTILEALPTIIPMESAGVSSELAKVFAENKIDVQTGVFVEGVDSTKKGIKVRIKEGDAVEAEMVLVAVGRDLNTFDMGLREAGVAVEKNGVVPVNEHMETGADGIYAIGDITGKWQLAHVATHQGIVAANNATGHNQVMHYEAVPSVIFTDPEIATVGLSLEKAQELGLPASLGAFPFKALGKAQAAMATEGFGQVVINSETNQVIGAQVIGHGASILIAEMAIAIANELTIECISDTIHAHPTTAEVWMEAAMMAEGLPLHLPPKRKKK